MTKPTAIRPLGELSLPNGINMMLYSDPGVGKTPLIATGANTLILDADHGIESAAGSPGVDVWRINDWTDMDEAHEYLRHERHPYKWVWFDGISVGQERLLTGIMEVLVADKPHRKVWQADKGDYGQNMFRLKQWVEYMSGLPFNFGITAHPFRWDDPVSGEEVLMPWVQGRNMSPTICSHMNIIGYLTGSYGDWSLYTRKKDNYYARDRIGALGPGMRHPTIPKIEAKVRARLKEATEKATAAKPAATPVKKSTTARSK